MTGGKIYTGTSIGLDDDRKASRETEENLAHVAETYSLGFVDAVRTLWQEQITPGVKIGSATYFAKQIVDVARQTAKKQLGVNKRVLNLLDTKIGRQVSMVVIPGAVWIAAEMFPSQIPHAARISAVAGYAVTGAVAEISQSLIARATPIFAAVAKMADELPEPAPERETVKPNGRVYADTKLNA